MSFTHKYDPISFRAIFDNFKTSPLNDVTTQSSERKFIVLVLFFYFNIKKFQVENLPGIFEPIESLRIISFPSSLLHVTIGSG